MKEVTTLAAAMPYCTTPTGRARRLAKKVHSTDHPLHQRFHQSCPPNDVPHANKVQHGELPHAVGRGGGVLFRLSLPGLRRRRPLESRLCAEATLTSKSAAAYNAKLCAAAIFPDLCTETPWRLAPADDALHVPTSPSR
jgi:hypothetical protein